MVLSLTRFLTQSHTRLWTPLHSYQAGSDAITSSCWSAELVGPSGVCAVQIHTSRKCVNTHRASLVLVSSYPVSSSFEDLVMLKTWCLEKERSALKILPQLVTGLCQLQVWRRFGSLGKIYLINRFVGQLWEEQLDGLGGVRWGFRMSQQQNGHMVQTESPTMKKPRWDPWQE